MTAQKRHRYPRITLIVVLLCLPLLNSCSNDVVDDSRANIVFINLDDADVDLLDEWAINKFFPNIKRLIQDRGLRFTNLHSVAPLCGPSRGSLFRGQYLHNTGIEKNALGWKIFYDRGYTDSEMGMWMREAGYETALVGKYCHEEYPAASQDLRYVPPGWDHFHASLGGRYFNFNRLLDGRLSKTGKQWYRTDLENTSVKEIIEKRDEKKPLFLYVAPFAPHKNAKPVELGMVAPRHKDAFSDEEIPDTPDFNEQDVSDKTTQFAALPLATKKNLEAARQSYRNRIRSMLAVDELIGDLFTTLQDQKLLENTYVFLSSDNGFQLLHHRSRGKKDPFDRTTRVQVLVTGPGVAQAKSYNHLLGHIDFTPTFLDIAGAPAPHFVDGKSFLDLLKDPDAVAATDWRDALLIENVEGKNFQGNLLDLEYVALRRYSDIYVEWANGDREFYDLQQDPYQLENQWPSVAPGDREKLAAELKSLSDCAGSSCNGGAMPDPINTQINLIPDTNFDDENVSFSGTASDDSAVSRVELVVRAENRHYLGESKFAPGYRNIDAILTAPGGKTTDWTYEARLRPGSYWISARAIDDEGNEDPVVPTVFFTVQKDSQ